MADESQFPKTSHQHKHTNNNNTAKNNIITIIITLFPVGGLLLLLSCITLTATIISLTVATPLFLIFSPVLVPAVLTMLLAITGFLMSAVFGITGLTSLSWIVNFLQQRRGSVEKAKGQLYDMDGPAV